MAQLPISFINSGRYLILLIVSDDQSDENSLQMSASDGSVYVFSAAGSRGVLPVCGRRHNCVRAATLPSHVHQLATLPMA
jgi:hypothetical protein